jgi:hypothetical protein
MRAESANKRPGFKISANLVLFTSIGPNGKAMAWFERGGVPVLLSQTQPKNFIDDTRYKAQCRALEWLEKQKVSATG